MNENLSWEKRPIVWDVNDKKHKLSTAYERSYRSSTAGNITYHGFADIGSPENHPVWQISATTYDDKGNLVSVKWAINSKGYPSGNYEFKWSDLSTYTFG